MRVLLVGASSFVGAYEVEELLKHDKYTGGGGSRNRKKS